MTPKDQQIKPIVEEIGTVIEARDGIVLMEGLPSLMAEEAFLCKNGVRGMSLGFDEKNAKGILFDEWHAVVRGTEITPLGKILEVPVGYEFIGRIITPLGDPLDSKMAPKPREGNAFAFYPIERIAPGVLEREAVTEPLVTGIKAIDALMSIGRGQRELLIGDRKLGKSSIALDAVLAQKETPAGRKKVICIFVSIGQKLAELAKAAEILRRGGAMDYTVIIAAPVSSPAALQYIAPYAAMATAEFFRDHGEDVLVVLDDLSKHAWAWRELSAMLERIPGREGYPGDVFYLHSRLLERAGKFKASLGGGSITALPIVQTQEGEISGYIPTNLISITDGQIYLESEIFQRGILPAINVGLSVSRIGGRAQHPLFRALCAGLRLQLTQYEELIKVGGFEIEISPERKKELAQGKALSDIFLQQERVPAPLEIQCLLIFGVQERLFEAVRERLGATDWQESFSNFVSANFPDLPKKVWAAQQLNDAMKEEFRKIIRAFV